MREYVLKSLIGQYVCKKCYVKYCHVDKVLTIEKNAAIVNLIVNTREGKTLHWFAEAHWQTDNNRFHRIKNIKILREDELSGYTEKDKVI